MRLVYLQILVFSDFSFGTDDKWIFLRNFFVVGDDLLENNYYLGICIYFNTRSSIMSSHALIFLESSRYLEI